MADGAKSPDYLAAAVLAKGLPLTKEGGTNQGFNPFQHRLRSQKERRRAGEIKELFDIFKMSGSIFVPLEDQKAANYTQNRH